MLHTSEMDNLEASLFSWEPKHTHKISGQIFQQERKKSSIHHYIALHIVLNKIRY